MPSPLTRPVAFGALALVAGLGLGLTAATGTTQLPPAPALPTVTVPTVTVPTLPIPPLPNPVAGVKRGVVVRVADGDTIRAHFPGGDRTIRLLGVDTPETVKPNSPVQCYGPEASAFTKDYIPKGSSITVTPEPETNDVVDRYGRLVGYVYVQARRQDLGAMLLRRGYAKVYVYRGRPFKRLDRYRKLEAVAKAKKLGRWKACPSG